LEHRLESRVAIFCRSKGSLIFFDPLLSSPAKLALENEPLTKEKRGKLREELKINIAIDEKATINSPG